MQKVFVLLLMFLFSYGCFRGSRTPVYYENPPHEIIKSDNPQNVIALETIDRELLEWAIFDETNLQRKRLGLLSFQYEYKLQECARQHSEEMIELVYFDHVSPAPKNATLKQRLRNAGIDHGMNGENIAVHPVRKKQQIVFKVVDSGEASRFDWRNYGTKYTYWEFAADLVRRWLNSKAHRHNILSSQFRFLGVGVSSGRFNNSDVFYVTQNFSSTNY